MLLLLPIGIMQVKCQGLRLPSEGYQQCLGVAASTGAFFDKPAVFLGLSLDYAYFIKEKWIVLAGIAYDQEHKTQVSEGEKKTIHTITPNAAIGYAINSRLAVGAGIGKGLWDTDNDKQELKFSTSGNLTVGVLCAYTFYLNGPHGFDITGGIERGLITPETNFTVEIGYGYSF